MILFLNKRDLFAEKLKVYPLTIAFPEYSGQNLFFKNICIFHHANFTSGDQSYSAGVDYIQKRFESMRKNATKQIYVHQTCATDTSNVQKVFDSCIVIIISSNL